MNNVLIQLFLSLIPQEYYDLYTFILINNSNRTFHKYFEYFYREYVIRDKLEPEDSLDRMAKLWNLAEGFEVLGKHLTNLITFVVFADNFITTGDALYMLPNATIKTGSF